MTCKPAFQSKVAALMLLVSLAAGCENQAHKFLGPSTVTVLEQPTRIEGWRYEYTEGAHDPKGTTPPKELDKAYADRLAKILLDGGTYSFNSAKGCTFKPTAGFKVYRDQQFVEVVFCLGCKEVKITSAGKTVMEDFDNREAEVKKLVEDSLGK